MGFYWLHEGNDQVLDIMRDKFFWARVARNKKYHMIKEGLANLVNFVAQAYIQSRALNTAILAKWIS